MSRIERSILQESERKHYSLQTGCYFSGLNKIEGAILVWSNTIQDPSWNLAGSIEVDEEHIGQILEDITIFLQEKERLPSVVITPFTKPQNLGAVVKEIGFQHKYTNVWMFYRGERPEIQLPEGLRILQVQDDEEMEIMIDLFNRAHSGAEDEVYGKLPAEYGDALRSFDPKRFQDRAITHYLAVMDGVPAGYATLINQGKFAGIYNVGTVPEFRRLGIGSSLTLNAVHDAFNQNSDHIYLMTEEGTSNERLYSKIGFNTEFTGQGYVLDTSSAFESTKP